MGEVCNKTGHIQSREAWSLESLEAKQLQWQPRSLPKKQRSLEATMEQQGELSERAWEENRTRGCSYHKGGGKDHE